jgi:hypothetical protein
LVSRNLRRKLARRKERGTTVLVVVMVVTLITAIGVFALRNVSQIDLAVGYSRQSAQTTALAELGTSASLSEVAQNQNYVKAMGLRDPSDVTKLAQNCLANAGMTNASEVYCFRLTQALIEGSTTSRSGETLTEPTVAGAESGSFGLLANTSGTVAVELTEQRQLDTLIAGSKDYPLDLTVTTSAVVSPISSSGQCGDSVGSVAVKKLMRAHIVVPPPPGSNGT